jgi:hypothetical protein
MRLHPDFPEAPAGADRWDLPAPLDDIASAFGAQYGTQKDPVALDQVATVDRYFIDSNGGQWTPETPDAGGSEVTLVLLGTLKDGRWFGLEAWNDYTGWGCQDGCDIYVGPTREDVVANGLTVEGRNHLGLSLAEA